MPFIGDLPADHEIFQNRHIERPGDDYLQHQLEEDNSGSPLRVDSPASNESDSDGNGGDIAALAEMPNEEEEENGRDEAEEQNLPSTKPRGRPSKGPASPNKKTPTSAVKTGGRGRPRGTGGPKPPAKTPTKGARASARVQEIAERPAPEAEKDAPAKKTATGKKRGRPAASAGRPAKKAKASREPEYEVEKIIDSTIDDDTFEHMYLVKWKGFSAKDNTWEPKENLAGCLDMVYQFDKEHKRVQAKEAAEEKKKAKAELAAARSKAKAEREAERAKAAAGPPKVPAKRGRKPKSERAVRGRPKTT